MAVQGDNLEGVLADLESASDLRLRLATLERIGTASGADAGVAESLRGQLQSIERIMAVREDLRGRLAALDADLDRVVARTVELSFGEDEHGELVELERRMDHLVTDMEALRRVVDHTPDSRPAE